MEHHHAPGSDNDHMPAFVFGWGYNRCRGLACFVENIIELEWEIHLRHTRREQFWINLLVTHDNAPFEAGRRLSGMTGFRSRQHRMEVRSQNPADHRGAA